jgi:sugar phosphate isomerase/epimerase
LLFEEDRIMKLGVFTVSMPDYELPVAMEKLAALGYDGLELRVCEDKGDRAKPSFWSGNRTSITAAEILAQAGALKAKARACGLEIPSLAAYIDSSNAVLIDEHCRAAAAIGARNVRVGPGAYDAQRGDYPAQLAEARARYADVAALAARHGVRAVIETHMGLLTPTVLATLRVLEGLDPRHVGIMWDPGNQVYEGREVYPMALEAAGPYLAEVHAKNATWTVSDTALGRTRWKPAMAPLRAGQVDWPEVIAALQRAGYDGWIMFEDFSTERPLDERLADNLAWFRELLR